MLWKHFKSLLSVELTVDFTKNHLLDKETIPNVNMARRTFGDIILLLKPCTVLIKHQQLRNSKSSIENSQAWAFFFHTRDGEYSPIFSINFPASAFFNKHSNPATYRYSKDSIMYNSLGVKKNKYKWKDKHVSVTSPCWNLSIKFSSTNP